jgi:Carbohydrate esterase, sialic acid-specific acetylesterase
MRKSVKELIRRSLAKFGYTIVNTGWLRHLQESADTHQALAALREQLVIAHQERHVMRRELNETKAGVSALQGVSGETLSHIIVLRRELNETKAGVSALQGVSGETLSHIIVLRRELAAQYDDLKILRATLERMRTLQASNASKVFSPSDIVIDEDGTYENLDHNWNSIHDTSGRQLSVKLTSSERSRTGVFVILGQSNAANQGAGHYVAKRQVDNFNIYDGQCYLAADPLLGASGDGGNFATRLGDKLIEAGLFDRVILAPIAMGGTTVEQWAEEGMFNRRIPVLIRRLHDAGLAADFILWHQGEGNPGMGDSGGRQYCKNLMEVIGTFRKYGVTAPFFVALATLCGGPHPNAENIRAGQLLAVNPSAGIYQGPDTDIIGTEYRWDACHFDETGLGLAATLWLEVIAEFQASMQTKAAV